jgi:hypothetical protein
VVENCRVGLILALVLGPASSLSRVPSRSSRGLANDGGGFVGVEMVSMVARRLGCAPGSYRAFAVAWVVGAIAGS